MNANADDREAQIPPDDDVVAGEYVLGVLDASARREARARIETDPGFAGRVRRWERHFDGWLMRAVPVRPSDLALPAIKARLGWSRSGAIRPRLWENVALWRTAAALLVAAFLTDIAVDLHWFGPPATVSEEQAAKPVTVLVRDDGSTGWIASIDLANSKVLMVPVPRPADARGRVDELWIIGAGKAPVSLGFVSNEKAHSIAVPANVLGDFVSGSTLAITLEPREGIPHAAPSGPILAKGGIQQI